MSPTIVMLCADENHHAGERDTGIALALALRELAPDVPLLCYKALLSPVARPFGPASRHPQDNRDYAAIPPWRDDIAGISRNSDMILIGAGYSTLNALIAAQARLGGRATRTAYVVHSVGETQDWRRIADHGITVFSPNGQTGCDATVIPLPAIPHTNTRATALLERQAFLKTAESNPHARQVRDTLAHWRATGTNFAIAVINAGFEIGGRHVHYTHDEAALHGAALGRHLPRGTRLYALEGGPRNGCDTTAAGTTASHFIAAYCAAQALPFGECLFDPFDPDALYNPLKVAFLLGNDPNCIAFISNAEGFGTVDGAIGIIAPRRGILLGAIPFAAMAEDPGLPENLEHYHRKGLAILDVAENGDIAVRSAPPASPHGEADSAALVIATLLGRPVST